ncbi:hypothetical protein [Bifidobacterium scaligerum]|uniref:ParB/Sulfiredoxin domain-containing protein n=1 Tax=Bifidobacterium scaligerum TaxID=2052656 RepID=A0A2M9HT52_9BIFI|nr:hypothetical protein [Bifidobacterium scaligerum]PJM79979.1 hypothetical protein CUU80_02260 [Bifidobacterium scaligerum]
MNKNTQQTAEFKYKSVMLTPSMAKELLAHNTHNRKVIQSRVNVWAESMKRGEWQFNGQPIVIAKDGTILDGQHRLLACVQSGATIPVLIIIGVEQDAQDTMDTGKARTLSDVLSLRGEKNATNLAALLTGLVKSEKYMLSAAFNGGSNYPVTNGECLEYLRQHPEVRDTVNIVKPASKNAYISQKCMGVLYTKFQEAGADYADDFLYKLSSGEGLLDGDPILTLRSTLKRIHDSVHGKPNYVFVAAIIIKTWNAFVNGKQLKILKYQLGGNKETFPVIEVPFETRFGGEES